MKLFICLWHSISVFSCMSVSCAFVCVSVFVSELATVCLCSFVFLSICRCVCTRLDCAFLFRLNVWMSVWVFVYTFCLFFCFFVSQCFIIDFYCASVCIFAVHLPSFHVFVFCGCWAVHDSIFVLYILEGHM